MVRSGALLVLDQCGDAHQPAERACGNRVENFCTSLLHPCASSIVQWVPSSRFPEIKAFPICNVPDYYQFAAVQGGRDLESLKVLTLTVARGMLNET